MKRFRLVIALLGSLSFLFTSSSLHAGVIFTNIFSFNGTNGALPSILVSAGNNKFYGITQAGGPNFTGLAGTADVGSVYSITSDGAFSNLFFFENTNGAYGGFLASGMDGNFYGTTEDTVFKLAPDGTMANPRLAALPDNSHSIGIVQDHDGTLYGTINDGGPSRLGTIYKVDTNGVLSTLVTFGGTNGSNPATLLLGLDDNFYGIATYGGDSNAPFGTAAGTIFRTDRNGNLTNIFVFTFPDRVPTFLVQGSDGDLYGSELGGTNDDGAIFRITTNGVLVWSFSFNGTNGYGPGWLTEANDGNFYGTTAHGGGSYSPGVIGTGYGTIFRVTPGGSFTSLVDCDGTNDDGPWAIVQGIDGNFYGNAYSGGTYGQGAIFKLTLPASPPTNRFMLTSVANFNDSLFFNNEFPENGLIQAGDGMLYGITQDGGTLSLGSVFRTTLSGSLTILVSFNGTNGMRPTAPPTEAADGNFYGTTGGGGLGWPTNSGFGTIYRMDSNGVLTTLFPFDWTNGAGGSVGGMAVGNDGALYGVTQSGGPNLTNVNYGDGTVFKITTNGDFTSLASFNGTNGVYPLSIIQANDGNFYGITQLGGIDDTDGFGTVFQMTPDGQINTLVRFNGTNGYAPTGLMQASDGCLYGTTYAGGAFYTGGASGYGTIFKVTTNGDFTLLASFDGTNGSGFKGVLTEVCNGVFYGTAYSGGLYPNGLGSLMANSGTFFQVTTSGDLTALFSFGANSQLPAPPMSGVIKASDGNYYGEAQFGSTAFTNNYGSSFPYPGAIFCIRPVQAPVLQPLAQPGQINFCWNAWLGYSYAVMYETDLTGSNWTQLSTVTPQTNGMTSFSDSIGPDPQRFYSVILQLP